MNIVKNARAIFAKLRGGGDLPNYDQRLLIDEGIVDESNFVSIQYTYETAFNVG